MAAINREVEIEYGGKTYSPVINMGLINKIEAAGVNIYQLASSLDGGGVPPLSLISTMYAMILQSCGELVTPDDVWEAINTDDTAAIVSGARAIIFCMFPQPEIKTLKKTKAKDK